MLAGACWLLAAACWLVYLFPHSLLQFEGGDETPEFEQQHDDETPEFEQQHDDEAPEFEQQHDDEAPEFEQQPTFQQKRAEKVCVVLVRCCHVADVDVKRME